MPTVTLLDELREDSAKGALATSGQVTFTHRREFRAECPSNLAPFEVGLDLGNNWGLYLGSFHPLDITSTLRSLDINREKTRNPWTYLCVANYSNEPFDQTDDPLAQPVEIRWATKQHQRAVIKDRYGTACLNTAGDYFDPPIEIPTARAELTAVRNEPNFSGPLALAFVFHVNQATYSGATPGTLLCTGIESERKIKNQTVYWATTYTFEYEPNGWQPEVLNQGIYQKNATTGKRERIYTDGREVTDPVPLDSGGRAIAPSSLPAAAVFRKFDVIPEADFAALGLPL